MNPFPQGSTFTPSEVGFDDKDDNGLPYDLLGRKAVGQRLTDLLERVEQPLVIALDGGWGSGKSHFLKLWTGAHEKELGGKAKVIYFDAFEHDYLDDPLISLVARLTTQGAEDTWGTKAVKAVKKAAYPLAKLSLRLGAAAASAGITEVVGPIADSIVSKVNEASQTTIDTFWKHEADRISAMQHFQEALTALTLHQKDGNTGQKIVFIIDELDRCRPDYALTLLEIVKHFFAVPNVHFVLGANLLELQNSVKARYGYGINASQYLQKFIHLTLTFPKVTTPDGKGSTALHYFNETVASTGISINLAEEIRYLLDPLSSRWDISLRDMQRVMTHAALFSDTFPDRRSGEKQAVIGALFLKILAPATYKKIAKETLSFGDMTKFLGMSSPPNDLSDYRYVYTWAIWARLVDGPQTKDVIEATQQAFARIYDGNYRSYLRTVVAHQLELFVFPTPK